MQALASAGLNGAAHPRPAPERRDRWNALRNSRVRRNADIRHYRHRQLRARRVHDAGCLCCLVSLRRRRHPVRLRRARRGARHRGRGPRRRSGAVSLHAQQSRQRLARLHRPDCDHGGRRASGLDLDAEGHALRPAGRAAHFRGRRAEDETGRFRAAAGGHSGDIRGAYPNLDRPRCVCVRPESRGGAAHGRQHRPPADRGRRLLHRARGLRRSALREPLFARADDGKLVHPQGDRGGHPGGNRQRAGIACSEARCSASRRALVRYFCPSAFRDAYGLIFLVAILLFKPAGLFAGRK